MVGLNSFLSVVGHAPCMLGCGASVEMDEGIYGKCTVSKNSMWSQGTASVTVVVPFSTFIS